MRALNNHHSHHPYWPISPRILRNANVTRTIALPLILHSTRSSTPRPQAPSSSQKPHRTRSLESKRNGGRRHANLQNSQTSRPLLLGRPNVEANRRQSVPSTFLPTTLIPMPTTSRLSLSYRARPCLHDDALQHQYRLMSRPANVSRLPARLSTLLQAPLTLLRGCRSQANASPPQRRTPRSLC